MIVTALDLSLNGTGMARYVDGEFERSARITVKVPKGASLKYHHERLERIEDEVAQFVYGSDVTILEGFSFGSFDRDKRIAGMTWIVRHRLWEEGIPYALVPPANRAAYVANHGKATKAEVMDVVNGFGFPYVVVDNDDEADAVVMAAMGCRHYGEPADVLQDDDLGALARLRDPLNKKRNTSRMGTRYEQLEKCVWPDL